MATRSVDEVAAELYALEPSAFVAARTDAVHAARDAGDGQLAVAIGKLRRPAQAAWAVNLLARRAADGLDELLSLGSQLREAQQQLQREALRQLSHRRHEVIAALTRQAEKLASEAGHPLGAGAIQQVRDTLGAAITDPEAASEVRLGRLVTPLSYAGFGPDIAVQPEDEPRHRPDGLARELAEARRELASLQQQAQRAAQELQRCEDAVAAAQRALHAATEQRDAAARHAQDAEHASRAAQSRAQRLAGAFDEPPSG